MAATALQFFIHGLPAPPELINQRLEEVVTELNIQEESYPVLRDLNQRGIKEVVVGPQHLAFLLDDGSVHRLAYVIESDKHSGVEQSEAAALKSRVGLEPPTKKPHIETEDPSPFPTGRSLVAQVASQNSSDVLTFRRAGSSSRPPTSGSSSGRMSSTVVASASPLLLQPQATRRSTTGSSTARRMGFGMTAAGSVPPPVATRVRSNPLMSPTAAVPLGTATAPASHRPVDPVVQRRSTVTSANVPEELVNQVQTVLQGKSRRAVIRELIRVNLDVNMALNNLLSRDDDDASEADEIAHELSVHPDEMLISLMEDAIDNPSVEYAYGGETGGSNRPASNRVPWTTRPGAKDHRERPQSWMGYQSSAGFVMKDVVQPLKYPEWVSEPLPKFVAIGALASELICISESGQLHQWRWDSDLAYSDEQNLSVFHPKAIALKLVNEKITVLAACSIRATFLTLTGKLATLMDSTVDVLARKLEHPATTFPELQNEKILDINVCLLYSCVRVESGYLYWWGVMPLGYRHRLWEKSRTKSKKPKPTVPLASDLQIGSSVIYRNGAVYQPGAIAFRVNIWGEVQCGELMDNMWDLSSIARFKLLDPKTGLPLTRPTDTAAEARTAASTESASPSQAIPGKRPSEGEHDNGFVIDSWQPKDVIVSDEGGRTPVIGKITKLQEDHAYVLFSQTESTGESSSSNRSAGHVSDVTPRCMKKSDLVLYKPPSTQSAAKVPECIQRTPKKLRISASVKKVLACAPNNRSIQMVVLGVSGKLSLVNYNLQSGKKDSQSRFLCDAKFITGRDENNVRLVTGGRDGLTVMLDGNRCFYPIEKDNTGSLRVPHPLNCSPIHSISACIRSVNVPNRQANRFPCAAVAFVVRKTSLIQSVLEADLDKIQQILNGPADILAKELRECADGARNVLHVCAAVCAPQPRKDFPRSLSSGRLEPEPTRRTADELIDVLPLDIEHSTGSPTADYINHMMMNRRLAPIHRRIARESQIAKTRADEASRTENQPEGMDTLLMDVVKSPAAESSGGKSGSGSRIDSAKTILSLLCSHPVVRKIFPELMASKNSLDMTPFMYAVLIRSYEAALVLLEATACVVGELYADFAAREVSTVATRTVDTIVMEFLYPPGSQPDDSPLFLLCLNDVCTYTWTGARHIQQDVWECRTCGLTGTLCCCTECARTCHRGHDCKIKRSSPTAYCDCWEKCKCKSLVSGDEIFRQELFSKLVNMSTDLVVRPNSKGEFLLQYLVQTVGRQLSEQRFLKTPRADERSGDLLNPPKFCQMALTHLLGSYEALKTALMTGYPNPRLATFSSAVQEDQFHLSYQSGTALLDRFVFVLLTKCNSEHVEAFASTIRSAAGDLGEARDISIEAQEMTSRFVRSVVRVFVVLTAESIGAKDKTGSTVKHLQKIRDVFRKLPMSSVVELCEAAEALLAPVRSGIARSTAGFTALGPHSADAPRGSDDLLSMEPLAERRRGRGRREPMVSVPASNRETDSDVNLAIPYEDDFDIVIPPDNSSRHRRTISHAVRNPTSGSSGAASGGAEPTSSSFSADSQSSHPLHDADAAAMSDMDIDDDADSDGTDSDNGHNSDFARIAAEVEHRDQLEGGVSQEAVFSDGENDDDDDNDDSENNSTHDDDDDEEEDEVESDGVDMDDGVSIEGDDDNLYPFFTMDGGRSGNAVYVRAAPSGSVVHHPRGFSGTSLPPGMQWATQQNAGRPSQRSRDFFPPAPGTRGSYYYMMDSFGLVRRSSGANDSSTPSFNSTFANLARSFSIIMREVVDLMGEMRTSPATKTDQIAVDSSKVDRLENLVDESLKKTWTWICGIMDSTEAQLRFGYALHQSSDTVTVHPQRERSSSSHYGDDGNRNPHTGHLHSSSHRKPPRDSSAAQRNDFLGYILSLMRAHNSEHGDSLPVLDVTALKHVAYVFDTLVNYISSTADSHAVKNSLTLDFSELDDDEKKPAESSSSLGVRNGGRNQPYLRRTSSMSYMGSAQPDPFKKALSETLPLADRPQMLLPNVRREELFGVRLLDYSSEVPAGSPANFKSPPVRLSLTNRQEDSPLWKEGADSDDEYGGDDTVMTEEHVDTSEGSYSARRKILGAFITQDLLLGRWRQGLDLFSRVFADDVGSEPNSLIGAIAAFPMKETKFRREMERLRGPQSRDLILDVPRARGDLIPVSFAILNAFFNRRGSSTSSLPCSKIKVTFRDEPGEGNGVARSFFTVIAEALLTQDKLPQLDRPAPPIPPRPSSHDRVHWMGHDPASVSRLRLMRDQIRHEQSVAGGAPGTTRRSASDGEIVDPESRLAARSWADVSAPAYRPGHISSRQSGWSPERLEMAETMLHSISALRPSFSQSVVQRITGMLMQMDMEMLVNSLQHDELLNSRIDDAANALHQHRTELVYSSSDIALGSLGVPPGVVIPPPVASKTSATKEEEKIEDKLNDDDDPLFYEPGRPGFFALRPGKNSSARMTAFRNVGRLIGLALLQGEIFPLCLTRGTVKYILGRSLTWSDFAFHDPIMYETLRKLVLDIEEGMSEAELGELCLYFAMDLPLEEGGKELELKPLGREKAVTRDNIYDFVRVATQARMQRVAELPLQALRRGVLDVITAESLELITAEDFRLLLNGVDRAIDVQQLASWTNWQDETHDKTQDKTRFKHWFWNTVDKFTIEEKQELLYFWTGSSAMPASEAGFAPLPSVTIRPADDLHLPTANTCISRLYIPQYSSKAIMRQKLLLAIKTKNFGFV